MTTDRCPTCDDRAPFDVALDCLLSILESNCGGTKKDKVRAAWEYADLMLEIDLERGGAS